MMQKCGCRGFRALDPAAPLLLRQPVSDSALAENNYPVLAKNCSAIGRALSPSMLWIEAEEYLVATSYGQSTHRFQRKYETKPI